jgi:hypothetical protein
MQIYVCLVSLTCYLYVKGKYLFAALFAVTKNCMFGNVATLPTLPTLFTGFRPDTGLNSQYAQCLKITVNLNPDMGLEDSSDEI